jgi:hypothetical protein
MKRSATAPRVCGVRLCDVFFDVRIVPELDLGERRLGGLPRLIGAERIDGAQR